MANQKPHRLHSAAKHMRADAKKRLMNRSRKSQIHTAENALNAAIEAGNKEAIPALLSRCFSMLDKAAKTNVIHQNKADRKKGRLFARVAKMA
ncbi:MAG: 30S ribosomal protein S20 [Victivallales bacterium]|nr:30S ribosomal protein S20 [Victivallales bacterium]